jgi:Mn2+/Fe2+ NRAMP family transporter
MDRKQLKLTGYFVLVILVLNIVLFAFTVIDAIVFWIVIILGALFVYKVLPKLKN